MKRIAALMITAALVSATPAAANHIFHTNDPFASRGACEAERAALSNEDDFLLDAFPDLFSSAGEVRSFLNRAFTCELNDSGSNWYIRDHRSEVLQSEWFQRRQ